MKIVVEGKTYKVPDLDALMASTARFLLCCERCKEVCSSVATCRCCQSYGTRSAGGGKIHYPDDGKGHRQLMPMATFQARMREVA